MELRPLVQAARAVDVSTDASATSAAQGSVKEGEAAGAEASDDGKDEDDGDESSVDSMVVKRLSVLTQGVHADGTSMLVTLYEDVQGDRVEVGAFDPAKAQTYTACVGKAAWRRGRVRRQPM